MKKNERQDLVTNIYTAAPSAHVFNGKIYIYPSHDEDLDIPEDDDGEQYVMKDYHILSMDSLDSKCVDNGFALSEDQIPWVSRSSGHLMPSTQTASTTSFSLLKISRILQDRRCRV